MPGAPRDPDPADPLHGLNPAEIFARALKTARLSGIDGLRGWIPLEVEELEHALPQFEISEMLGVGGMGAVYKGVQRSLDRPVAIKVLPPGIGDTDEHYGERFKLEAKAMARLSHPGIVAVFDAGQTADGLLYFVMEYVEGTDVQKMLEQGPFPSKQALAITAHVCDALAFAHESGIIHRDIKPANVMVDTRGRVKVADFGLAKAVSLDSGGFTQTGLTMGTPDYIAPETIASMSTVDGRADLYAVGVMLYVMLTGHVPRGRFTMPSGVIPQIDPRFDAIVDKAMQTDRELRYATAGDLRADLDRILTEPIPVAAPEPKPPPPPRRSKAPVVLAGAAVAIFATGGFFVWKNGAPSSSRPIAPISATPSAAAAKAAARSPSYPQPAQWIDATGELIAKLTVDSKAAVIDGDWLRIVNGPGGCSISAGREFHNVAVRMVCSGKASITVRESGNMYYHCGFGLNGNGGLNLYDNRQSPGRQVRHTHGLSAPDFDPAAEHELVVAAQDDKITTWLDGVEKATMRDTTVAQGKIGVQFDAATTRIRRIEYAELPEAAPAAKAP